ncbi:MAG TPA: BTAD domain-containing putative transcriptional regulator [Mycobacteriales bacterium]|nr:BTAD domain-containing putative transcriptional regulator [Mycobacteriales bacterium]
MRFGVLGPLLVEGVVLPRSRMQRLLLAMLLSRVNEPVSSDLLVEELWEGRAPGSARTNLQVYVHRLRRVLGEERIEYGAPGYRIVVAPGEFDVDDFEQAAAVGRRAAEAGDQQAASDSFGAALDRWRGSAYAGLEDHPFLRDEAARLNELRLATIEDRFEVDLALGRHGEAVAELAALVRRHPLRERLCGQLMLALYRSGRAASALEVYRQARDRLVEEIGVEPGSELQRLHEAVLRADPALEVGSRGAAPVVPAELPPNPPTFTGRQPELALMSGRLDSGTDDPPVIAAINGRGGIGKSTLAVRISHEVAGRYPGGQLYVNLRAATPGIAPLSPADALGRLLRSLGLEDAAIPSEVDEAAARFRSLTGQRRLLVVLDDAADATQVRPLLPGAGCAVLVTSRHVLATLDGAQHLHLEALTAEHAIALLGELAGAERVAAEPEAAADIVRFCGYLPLAVRIAGARLAARPDWELATLARRLHDVRDRLDELEHADLAVRASCAVSYQSLPPAPARLFELLGTLELPDVTAPVVGALADLPERQARRRLDQLVDAQLLSSAGDRYALHDLVRLYAREQAEELDPAERSAAVERVLHHYLATARAALRLTRANADRRSSFGLPESELRVPGLDLPDAAAATAWAAAESANLVAIARHAASRENGPAVLVGLSVALVGALEGVGRLTELTTIGELALVAAEQLGQDAWRSMIHHDLGWAYTNRHRYTEAEKHALAALEGFRKAQDENNVASSLNDLGSLANVQGRADKAIEYFRAALAIVEDLNDLRGQALVLSNMGAVHSRAGRREEAIPFCEQALAKLAEDGDHPSHRALLLANLGANYEKVGRSGEALGCLEEALATFRDTGERQKEALMLWGIGEVMAASDRASEARDHWRRSLDLLCELELMSAAEAAEILAQPVPAKPLVLERM